MTTVETRKQLPEDFYRLHLRPDHFHAFYNIFVGLRFPMEVAEVLDLRSLINHAVDDFADPPLTPDHRQFNESLEKALDSIEVENPRHRERLLKTFTMIRELHVAHSLASRNDEQRLRTARDDNHSAHNHAIRSGVLFLLATVVCAVGWYIFPRAELLSELLSIFCLVHAWKHFRALPRIERQATRLQQQFEEVLRLRVNAINWKTLVHKLALVLGFKKIQGIEVFHMDTEHHDGPYH